jgi:hypothetical protein
VTLTELSEGETYCVSFSYSLSGTGMKRIFVEEQPSKRLKELEGESLEWQQAQLTLQGHDALVGRLTIGCFRNVTNYESRI